MKEKESNDLQKETKKKNVHNKEENTFCHTERQMGQNVENICNVSGNKENGDISIYVKRSGSDRSLNKNETLINTVAITCEEKENPLEKGQAKKIDNEINSRKHVGYLFEKIPVVGAEKETSGKVDEEKEIYKKENNKEHKRKHAKDHIDCEIQKDHCSISENVNLFPHITTQGKTDVVTRHDNKDNSKKKKEKSAKNVNTTDAGNGATHHINNNSSDMAVGPDFIPREKLSETYNINDSDIKNEDINITNDFCRKPEVETSNVIENRNDVDMNNTRDEYVNLEYRNNSAASIPNTVQQTIQCSDIREQSNFEYSQREHMDEEISIYMKPFFLSKLFGYKIDMDFEVYSTKRWRVLFFIVLLLLLFILDFFLLYRCLILLEPGRKLILIENKFNNVFQADLLYITRDESLQQHRVTVDNLQKEISNYDYILHNQMCTNLRQFAIPCGTWIELYLRGDKNTTAVLESAKTNLKQLEEKNIYMYKIKEGEFVYCNDISRRHFRSGGEQMFLFIDNTKYIKMTITYVIFTLMFIFARGLFILSRILYEILILLYYKEFKLTLKSKKQFLMKYLWFICTVSIIQIMLGESCLIWKFNGIITPMFLYYFQYTVWTISIVCCITYAMYLVCKKYKGNSGRNNDDNTERNRRQTSFATRNASFSLLTNLLNCTYQFLFYFNIIISSMYLISNIHISIVVVMGLTILSLLIDIATDSYLNQVRIVRIETMHIFQPEQRKKFYLIEIKKKNADFLELTKINEHTYQRMPVLKINIVPSIENEVVSSEKQGTDVTKRTGSIAETNEFNNCDTGNAKKKKKDKFFANLFNKKYFYKNSNAKSLREAGDKIENGSYNATLEFCEICDEHYSNIILYPCMHGGFCEACIRSMLSNAIETKNISPQCPLCRENIHRVYKIGNIDEEENQQKIKAYRLLTIRDI